MARPHWLAPDLPDAVETPSAQGEARCLAEHETSKTREWDLRKATEKIYKKHQEATSSKDDIRLEAITTSNKKMDGEDGFCHVKFLRLPNQLEKVNPEERCHRTSIQFGTSWRSRWIRLYWPTALNDENHWCVKHRTQQTAREGPGFRVFPAFPALMLHNTWGNDNVKLLDIFKQLAHCRVQDTLKCVA